MSKSDAQADKPKSKLEELQAELAESYAVVEQAAEARAQLKVLESQISARESQLKTLADKTRKATASHEALLKSHGEDLVRARQDLDSLQVGTAQTRDRLEQVRKELEAAKAELERNQEAARAEKRSYETLTLTHNQDIQKHRERMKLLEQEETQARKRIDILIAELERQAKTKEMNDERLSEGVKRLVTLDNDYQSRSKQYRLDLAAAEIEVGNKRSLLASFDAQMQKRQQELDAKEQSLNIQASSLVRDRKDLADARRKFESDKAIYTL